MALAACYFLVAADGLLIARSCFSWLDPTRAQPGDAGAGHVCPCAPSSICRAESCCCAGLEPMQLKDDGSTKASQLDGAALEASRCAGGMPVDAVTGIAKVPPHIAAESQARVLEEVPTWREPASDCALRSRPCDTPLEVPRAEPTRLT